jgi:superfamily II DNA or RNA helicase
MAGGGIVSALRGYQAEALDSLDRFYDKGGQRGGVSLPTGTGKTHIMAHIGKNAADRGERGRRVLYLLHRDTLVEQTVAKLRTTVTPGTSIGVLKGPRNETGANIIVASVHSLRTESRRRALPPISVCVVDEAHVSITPTYRRVYDRIGAFEPGGARLAGFSATWTRSDAVGLGDVWEDVVFARTIRWAVQNRHLVTPRAIQVGEGLDLSDVRVSRDGEYREDDAAKAVTVAELADSVVRGMQQHGAGRPAVLFAPTVESAEFFGDALRAAGISAAGIYGTTPAGERRPRFAAHREGSLRVLTTCTALAEGWDAPYCSLGLLVRPTRHEGLFVQMFGRLLRPWPGKPDALLLDFVGATDNVALRNAVDLAETVTRENGTAVELEEDDAPEDTEVVSKERVVYRRKTSYEVEIMPGSDVHWLVGPAGVPFVPCGESLVFIIEGPDGWNVGQILGRHPNGNPMGRFIHSGLTQEDSLVAASEFAESAGAYLAQRSAAWRSGKPSDAQLSFARTLGIADAEKMARGALSDSISVAKANWALQYFAEWSNKTTGVS